MKYQKIQPDPTLAPFIHFYWELKGSRQQTQRERVFPDGCTGILMNLGGDCLTDNGSVSMTFGKTYVVGAMHSFKDSYIESDTHLIGVCLKPAAFANFYDYTPQDVLTNDTVELEAAHAFIPDKIRDDPFRYFNRFFSDHLKSKTILLQPVIDDIHAANGQISIYELSQRHFTSLRQLQRNFKKFVGLSPKEYSNIIRFQHALRWISHSHPDQSFLDIAFECGYYDHSHLSHAIRRNTGLPPSLL